MRWAPRSGWASSTTKSGRSSERTVKAHCQRRKDTVFPRIGRVRLRASLPSVLQRLTAPRLSLPITAGALLVLLVGAGHAAVPVAGTGGGSGAGRAAGGRRARVEQFAGAFDREITRAYAWLRVDADMLGEAADRASRRATRGGRRARSIPASSPASTSRSRGKGCAPSSGSIPPRAHSSTRHGRPISSREGGRAVPSAWAGCSTRGARAARVPTEGGRRSDPSVDVAPGEESTGCTEPRAPVLLDQWRDGRAAARSAYAVTRPTRCPSPAIGGVGGPGPRVIADALRPPPVGLVSRGGPRSRLHQRELLPCPRRASRRRQRRTRLRGHRHHAGASRAPSSIAPRAAEGRPLPTPRPASSRCASTRSTGVPARRRPGRAGAHWCGAGRPRGGGRPRPRRPRSRRPARESGARAVGSERDPSRRIARAGRRPRTAPQPRHQLRHPAPARGQRGA